ncbi:MAG: transporter family protein [Alphaproteobacteria bacterium]|nr:transporter family protein [Alphaproteobacteria bacterium]
MIIVENLVFDYPTKRALHGVSLVVREGSITALVGPNGAGKTTLMRCIAALDPPYSGRIAVAGIDVFEEPRQAHEVMGYLSDFFGLYDQLTVRQCLVHAADSHGLSAARREERVQQTAIALGLEDRLNAKAETLSRGLRQRLAIAQAIVHEPRVLLLDEPAAGLDPEARQDLSTLLRGLAARGMTLLVSSHILAELEDYSTDMVIVDNGRIVENRSLEPGAVQGATQGVPRVAMLLELAADVPEIAATVQAIADVADVDGSGREIRFTLPDDANRRAALLRQLIGAGVPVAGLSRERSSLQDSYIKRVNEARQVRP